MAERVYFDMGANLDGTMQPSFVMPVSSDGPRTANTQSASGSASVANFTGTGAICGQCGEWLPAGCSHFCKALWTVHATPAPPQAIAVDNYWLVLAQLQEMNQKLGRLVELLEARSR